MSKLLGRPSNSNSSNNLKRYLPAIITAFLLTLGFYLFFDIQVKNNEAEFRERKFRALNQIALNITNKIKRYREKNAGYFMSQIPHLDSVQRIIVEDEYGLTYQKTESFKVGDTTFLIDKVNLEFIFNNNEGDRAVAPIQAFITPLLRKDIFPYFMVGLNDQVIYDELNKSESNLNALLSTAFKNDSIHFKTVRKSGDITEIMNGGTPYLLLSMSFEIENYKMTIGGYIPLSEYRVQRNAIPIYSILWMIVGALAVILMIPLLKVFLMHDSEQFVTTTAIGAFAALHVLSSMILLICINSYVYFYVVKRSEEKNIQEISKSIISNINEERKKAIEALQNANSLISQSISKQDPYRLFVNDLRVRNGIAYLEERWTVRDSINNFENLFHTSQLPFFSHIVWTDVKGEQKVRWTTDNVVPYKIKNMKERDYFQAIESRSLLSSDSITPHFFGAIPSWISQKTFALVSTPVPDSMRNNATTKDWLSILVSGRFRSLYENVLPYGFGFCIVDRNGLVVFHQDERRNFNENLIKECVDNAKLSALIRNNDIGYVTTKYLGLKHRFYCAPLNDTFYSVIVFRNVQLSWNEDVDVLTVTAILALINLGIFLLVILFIRILSVSRGSLWERSFAFTWLRPNYKIRADYRPMVTFYGLSAVSQLGYFLWDQGEDNQSMLVSTYWHTYVVLIATYVTFAISPKSRKTESNRNLVIFLSLVVALIVTIVMYVLTAGNRSFFAIFLVVFHCGLYTLLVWPRWGSVNRSKNESKIFGAKLNTIIARFHKIHHTISGTVLLEEPATSLSFRKDYTSFVFSLIVCTSIVPIVIFFCMCYREEKMLARRYVNVQFARHLANSPFWKDLDTMHTLTNNSLHPVHYGSFAQRISTATLNKHTLNQPKDEFSAFYKKLKPSFSIYSEDLERIKSGAEQRVRYWWPKGSKLPKHSFLLQIRTGDNTLQDRLYWVFHPLPNTILVRANLFDTSFLWMVIACVLLLLAFYYLLTSLIRQIFFKGVTERSLTKKDHYQWPLSLPVGNVFLNGPPNSGKMEAFQQALNAKQSVIPVDLTILEHSDAADFLTKLQHKLVSMDNEKSVLVVSGLNQFSLHQDYLHKKLIVLESLMRTKNKIVILSSRSVEIFLENIPNTDTFDQHALAKRWDHLFRSFTMIYHRWHPSKLHSQDFKRFRKALSINLHSKINESNKINSLYSTTMRRRTLWMIHRQVIEFNTRLEDECFCDQFLSRLYPQIAIYANDISLSVFDGKLVFESKTLIKGVIFGHMKFLFQQVCLKVEELSVNHYNAIWSSLSRSEQKTLYDVALDELVNPSNRKTAVRLLEVGLIKPIPYIACYNTMNVSFRNYVLNKASTSEIITIKKEAAEKGFSKSVQLPLVIIALAALIFLFLTQKESLMSFLAFFGAAITGISALLRLISAVPDSKH